MMQPKNTIPLLSATKNGKMGGFWGNLFDFVKYILISYFMGSG